ncbi:MAG TPA: tetratricopeptide repeat protein [Tepidisphaeraceae bacterium]
MPLPSSPSLDLALHHHQAGRLREAETIYQQILILHPNDPLANFYLAGLAYQTHRLDVAISHYQRAASLKPDWPEAHNNLANCLVAFGRFPEAIAAAQRAIELRPDYPEAFNNLGYALQSSRNYSQAITALNQAIVLRPNFAEAYNNLGNAYRGSRQPQQAIAAYQQAININPNFAEAFNNLGNAFQDQNDNSAALAAYRRAIALRPNYAKALCNLANALKDDQQPHEALDTFRKVIALEPNLAEAHANLALLLLSIGDYEQGWLEYEWRRKCADLSVAHQVFSQPQWTGEALNHRRILIHTEQGFGDAIQFARYLPLVAERGGQIILQCQPSLIRLFSSLPVHCQIIPQGDQLPDYDLHCPLLSLAHIFQTTLATLPQNIPYLHAHPDLVDQWNQKLGPRDGRLRIGLTWAGNPRFPGDAIRSMHIKQLAPLSGLSGVQLFSLQKGIAAGQISNAPSDLNLIDLSADLNDFADTAAVMSILDLVITTDTSVAHLAGALGRPTWLMLQANPDWRWLPRSLNSLWYPSLRLFYQPAPGDWESVILSIRSELNNLASTN